MIDCRRFIAAEIGAAIATGIGAVSSSAINAASQARTNAINRQQAQDAFAKQQNAIREMNSYNSPAQQVLRMKAAGLNPALAYGADGQMVGNQSDIGAYQPIPAEAPNVGNVGAGIAEAVRTGIEVKDLERKQALAVAEMALMDGQTFLAVTGGELNEAQVSEIVNLMGYKMENYESLTQLNWENVLKTRKEMTMMDEQMKEIRSRIGLNEAQIEELAARAGLEVNEAYAILAKLPHEIYALDSTGALNYAQSAYAHEAIFNLAAERYQMGFVREMEQKKFDFDVNSKVADLEMRRYEARVGTLNHLQDNVAKVVTLGVGAAAMKHGEVLPPRRVTANPAGHHGGRTSTYSDFTPATGAYKYGTRRNR